MVALAQRLAEFYNEAKKAARTDASDKVKCTAPVQLAENSIDAEAAPPRAKKVSGSLRSLHQYFTAQVRIELGANPQEHIVHSLTRHRFYLEG